MKSTLPLRYWRYAAAAIAVAVGVGLGAPAAGATSHIASSCTEVSIPVALQAGGPATAQISGSYCTPSGDPGTTLQILVPGATYDRSYWDFPGFNRKYSYVEHASRAGKATLAIDPVGVGKSSKPAGWQVSALSASHTLHEVISAARSGQFGHRWDKVILVGHSFGSLTAMLAAGTYHDVDGLGQRRLTCTGSLSDSEDPELCSAGSRRSAHQGLSTAG